MADSEKPAFVTPQVFSDKPLGADDEAEFQFDTYSDTLARLILSRDTQVPLTISISGEWGSGKTSLMRILQDKLNATQKSKDRKELSFVHADELKDYDKRFRPCRTVWFNPWKYSRQEEMFVALTELVLREMEKKGFLQKVRAALADPKQKKFNLFGFSISAITQILSMGQMELDTSKYQEESRFRQHWAFYDEFQDFFKGLIDQFVEAEGVLVVLIDDLDRCLPSKIVQVLESTKLFMDQPRCVFVLGADYTMVAKAVQAHYEETKLEGLGGDEYLDKVVQVQFELPAIRPADIEEYVKNLRNIEEPTRAFLNLISSGVKTNPRRIKTFLNYIELQWAILANSGAAELASKERLVEWSMLSRASPAFRLAVERIGKDDEKVQLIASMKALAESDPAAREALVKEDKTLVKLGGLVTDETLLEVLTIGSFSFTAEDVGLYVHRTTPPSLAVPSAAEEESVGPEPRSFGAPRSEELHTADREAVLDALKNGQSLTLSNLSQMDLVGVQFNGVDLSESWLDSANLDKADLSDCGLRDVDMYTTSARGASFQRADFSRAHIFGSDFSGANLNGAILGAVLANVNLSNAHLAGADFRGGSLVGGNVEGADFKDAKAIVPALNWVQPPDGLASAKFNPEVAEEIKRRLAAKS